MDIVCDVLLLSCILVCSSFCPFLGARPDMQVQGSGAWLRFAAPRARYRHGFTTRTRSGTTTLFLFLFHS
jgi:hypothetical protein